MAGSRAASVIGGTNNGAINTSNGPYNNSSGLSPSIGSPPPLPQVPPPPASTLDVERIRWAANPGVHHNFNDQLKQNVYAVSTSECQLFTYPHQRFFNSLHFKLNWPSLSYL